MIYHSIDIDFFGFSTYTLTICFLLDKKYYIKRIDMWEDNVRRVVPYVPGEQPRVKNLIKLNTNENPYPPSPLVYKAMREFDCYDLKKYPDPNVGELVKALSETYNVPEDRIFVGVGSDDVLATAFLTFFNSDKPILFPDISYSFYDVWGELYGIPYEQIPVKEDFSIDINDYLKVNGGIVIANPNAPTGLYEDLSNIEELLKKNTDSVVIIDEAYIDFGGRSALPLIEKYDNLLVVRTYSKSRSMAGIRIGYAFGSKKLIKYMLDVKFSVNSYTMNMPSIKAGVASLKDPDYFKETTEKIISTREWTKKELKKRGFSFPNSMTNFIFARHESLERDYIFNKLREENILVRAFNGERIKEYLRISIGTDEEMKRVMEVLDKIV